MMRTIIFSPMNRLFAFLLITVLITPSQVLAYSDPFEEMFQQAFEEGQLPEAPYIESDGSVTDAAAFFRELDSQIIGPQPLTPPTQVVVPEPEPVPVVVEVEPEPVQAELRVPEGLVSAGDKLRLENFQMDPENSRKVSFTVKNVARHAVGPFFIKRKYYDDSVQTFRFITQKVNWVEGRDELVVQVDIPQTVVGGVDVRLEVEGRTYENQVGAFVYPGKAPQTVDADTYIFEDASPIVQVMKEQAREQLLSNNKTEDRIWNLEGVVLDQARKAIRNQALYYNSPTHDDALDEIVNVYEMYDLIGDGEAEYFPTGDEAYQFEMSPGVARHVDVDGYDHFIFPNFSSRSMSAFNDFLELLRQRGSEGIVFDLRGNRYGTNHQAVDVVEPFLDASEIIMYIKSRTNRQGLEAYNKSLINEISMMILVDQNTGQAAEVLAAALKENGFGQLIGEPTAGDTVIYNYTELSDGSMMVLTYANWFTGKFGRDITGTGLEVDHNILDNPATPEDESLMKAIELFELRKQEPDFLIR